MPKEKWDLTESPAEHRPKETGAVEVKFGGTAASFFEHLRLAPSGEIPVHDTSWRSRRVAGGFRRELPEDVGDHLREATEISSAPFGARSVMREDEYFATG
jgi:hypothetical protein